MFEHLYGYGQPEQQEQSRPQPQQHSQQPTDQTKQLQSFDAGAYNYDNPLDDVPSTSTLPAFAFLSQHSGLDSQLHLQEPQQFNAFSHDTTTPTTTNTNNAVDTNSCDTGNGTYSMNRRSSSMDEPTSTFSQFSAFQSLGHHDITDAAAFTMPQLYHHPVDISTIVNNSIVAVPDLPMTLPPLQASPTAPPYQNSSSISILQSDNLPASKKQRLARGFRERAPWTPEEDNLLRLAVQLYGDKTEKWAKIAECVQGRTNKNCRKRWFHSLDPSLRKGAWTDDEDQLLRQGVKKFPNQWSKIADMLEGRTDDQCAKRWRESLDPSIDRSDWTLEEDARLASKFEEFGSQWQKIAQYFDGRPGLHCRNRWRKLQRIAQIKKEKERSSLYLSSSAAVTATTTTTKSTSDSIVGQGEITGTHGKTRRNGSTSGYAETTAFINMGPHHHQYPTITASPPLSNNNNNNNTNNGGTSSTTSSSISALISSTSSPSSSPSLSSPSSASSSSTSSSSASPASPPSASTTSSTTTDGNTTSSTNSNTSSLSTLLQPQTFHTTSRPQNSITPLPGSNTNTVNTTFDAMYDRRQQDYEAPEPLGHLNPYGCHVFGCMESFSQSSGLFYHMKNVHPDLTNVAKPYRCAVANCSKTYKNINGLQYHLRDAKGISSHILISAPSSPPPPLPPKPNNDIQHGEIIIPTLVDSNNNSNNGSSSTTTTTALNSDVTAPAPTPIEHQLHSLSMDNFSSTNDILHHHHHDRPFNCPMIGCKASFGSINGLKLHQDHSHSNPFQLAAITALTNPLVDSLLQPATTTTTPHSLATPSMAISSSVTTFSLPPPPPSSSEQQPLNQNQNQNQNQNHFRVRREKWIMESV